MDRDLGGRLISADSKLKGVMSDELRNRAKVLNLGCGFVRMLGATNVDVFENCKPDVLHDLDDMPWPFENESYDVIYMDHVLEHIKDWWAALRECARILKTNGSLMIFVPDQSNCHALAYRDHLHVFTIASFHNFKDGSCSRTGTNAFAKNDIEQRGPIPLRIEYYRRVPFPKYRRFSKWFPRIFKFCADHMTNFIDEQQIGFKKIGGKNE